MLSGFLSLIWLRSNRYRLTVNKLGLNLNKTCYSVYSSDFKIALNGVEIKRVKSCKYIGVIIDDELKFDVH